MSDTTNPGMWEAYCARRRAGWGPNYEPPPTEQEDVVGAKKRIPIRMRLEQYLIQDLYATKLVGSSACIGAQKGMELFNKILVKILRGAKISLSFKGVEYIDSSFLRSSLGRLYANLSEEEITDAFSIVDATDQMLLLMKEYLPYLEIEE